MLLRKPFDLIVVDDAGFSDEAVLHRLEEFAREVDLGAVRQMTAMIEAHA